MNACGRRKPGSLRPIHDHLDDMDKWIGAVLQHIDSNVAPRSPPERTLRSPPRWRAQCWSRNRPASSTFSRRSILPPSTGSSGPIPKGDQVDGIDGADFFQIDREPLRRWIARGPVGIGIVGVAIDRKFGKPAISAVRAGPYGHRLVGRQVGFHDRDAPIPAPHEISPEDSTGIEQARA